MTMKMETVGYTVYLMCRVCVCACVVCVCVFVVMCACVYVCVCAYQHLAGNKNF